MQEFVGPIKRYPEGMSGGKPRGSKAIKKAEKKSKHARAEAEKWFWDMWSKTLGKGQRLGLLEMAARRRFKMPCDMDARRVEMRRQFNKGKLHIHLNGTKCRVCGDIATQRHHIFTLDNGGRNHRRNIMLLCGSCHGSIHPWLGESWAKDQNEKLDSEMITRIEAEV